MAYTNFGGGSTLTADERAAEAERILARFKSCCIEQLVDDGTITEKAGEFLEQKLDELETFGKVGAVSENQLFWLRDLGEKI